VRRADSLETRALSGITLGIGIGIGIAVSRVTCHVHVHVHVHVHDPELVPLTQLVRGVDSETA
jgi:hypothetical protein